MGSAMLRSWINSKNVAGNIIAYDPYPPQESFESVTFYDDLDTFKNAAPETDIFILAVKPQIMGDVCASIKGVVKPDALILSIAAGQTIASFEERFSANQPIIRVMPNTPAAIGRGMSVAIANPQVTDMQKEQADTLLRSVGKVEWIDDEDLLNAVTAVSGSGPAYIFHMIEAMAAAGENAGLSPALAMTLARETVIGAAALAEADSNIEAAQLRKNVTSPGGTTEAALNVMMDDENGLTKLMTRAIRAAKKRGEELA